MTKRILITLMLVSAMCFAPSMLTEASARVELSDIDTQPIVVSQSGSSIIVTGAMNKTLYVYNIIGIQIQTIRIDSPEKKIDLSSLKKGIYPIKVGNVTKKIRL
mgnify:CR=1 FL=1